MSSLVGMLDIRMSELPIWCALLIYIAILAIIVLIANRHRWLTLSGLIASFIIGLFVLYLGGFSAFIILLFFFIGGSLSGKISRSANQYEKKGDKRDSMQVLANSIPALVFLLLSNFGNYRVAGLVAYSSAIAEALADTFSGDIGRLSQEDPVSIITFTKVPKGISGGVTLLGFSGGLAASFLVALLHIGTYPYELSRSFVIIAGTGFLGSFIDSVLGATLQVQYRKEDGTLTEKSEIDGKKLERARGIPFIDNDAVNFISGLMAAVLAFVIAIAII